MDVSVRRLRGPLAVHLGGVLLIGFGFACCAYTGSAPGKVSDWEVWWAIETAPYTLTALAWAWRPGRSAVRRAAAAVAALGSATACANAVDAWAVFRGHDRGDAIEVACITILILGLQYLLGLMALAYAAERAPEWVVQSDSDP